MAVIPEEGEAPPLADEQIRYEREPIPFTPVKRLLRDDILYVTEKTIPHPIKGYAEATRQWGVVDIRGFRKGYEPRQEIRGTYTLNPRDVFRIQTGHLPPYQPIVTGDKVLQELRRLGWHSAYRIAPTSNLLQTEPASPGTPPPKKTAASIAKGLLQHPIALTMSEYEQKWKPQGWNIIFIGPTSTWRQDWGTWEAIRDIVQNCLDEAEAYEWGYDDLGLWISDQGRGVAVADFLLGPPKMKPDYARGKFGEGMKISALAMVRDGYPVKIETVGRELFVVFLDQEVNGHVQSLAALWRPNGTKVGTTFHFIDYKGSSYPERFAVNLPRDAVIFMGNSLITLPVPRFNQLIDTSKINPAAAVPQSVIFARDIYMAPINSPYSYNLWDFELAPDRFAPKDQTSLYRSMARLWACCEDPELLKILLQMIVQPPLLETAESNNLELGFALGENPATGISYQNIMEQNKAAWKQAWNENFGDNTVIRTDAKYDGMVKHLGYKSQSVGWSAQDALKRLFQSDSDLIAESQERLRDVEVIPDTNLTPRARININLARAIAEDVARQRKVRGVRGAIIPPASDRVRTAGMYGRSTEEIFISADQLERARNTVDTVIHELAHHTTGAEDGEEAHNAELSRLGGRVVELTARGNYDGLIKDETFVW